MFSPSAVLRLWLCAMLSLAVIALSAFLLSRWYDELPREKLVVVERGPDRFVERVPLTTATQRLSAWRPGADKATAFLATVCGLVAWTTLGSLISPRLLRRRNPNEPTPQRGGETRCIERPDGTKLQVEVSGPPDAQSVILTHGWGTDSTIWYQVRQHLSKRFRVIVWDLPGLGRSTSPANQDFSLEKMAGDLRAIIDSTEGKPVLLGHSIGGMIILTLCRVFPQVVNQRVVGLILTNTTYTNPLRTMAFSGLLTILQQPLIVPLLHLTIWLSPLVRLMNVLSYLNGSTHWTTEWEAFAGTETRGQLDFAARFSAKTSPAVFARGALAMLKYDATSTIEQIDLPALVIAANKDPVTKPEASKYIETRLPQGRYSELSPGKHLSLLEQHNQFVEVVEQFLETVEDLDTKIAGKEPERVSNPRS